MCMCMCLRSSVYNRFVAFATTIELARQHHERGDEYSALQLYRRAVFESARKAIALDALADHLGLVTTWFRFFKCLFNMKHKYNIVLQHIHIHIYIYIYGFLY